MAWHSLLKAKDNARSVLLELDRMLKGANSLGKKDIVNYRETVLSSIDKSILLIEDEMKELETNLKQHRKYFESKSVFLRRHHKHL